MQKSSALVLFVSLIASLALAPQAVAEPAASAQQVSAENLKELIGARNARSLAAHSEAQASKERQGSLSRSFLPSLELHAGQEQFKIGEQDRKTQPVYGAEAKINLYNGGRDGIESQIRDVESQRRSFQAQRIQSEELEQARTLYWQILYIKEKSVLLKAALIVNNQNLLSAKKRIRNGVATDSDRFEFEMKDVELRREVTTDTVEQEKLKRTLAMMLDISEASLTLIGKLTHDHDYEAALVHAAKDHEFLYKEDELQAEQLQMTAKTQSRALLPKIDIFAGYSQYNEREKEYPDSKDRTESVVGVRANIDLGLGFEAARESAALRYEASASARRAASAKRQIEIHIQGELDELNNLHAQIHEAEENIKRAEGYYKLTQGEYGRGVKNSPDVLSASLKLYDMQHKYVEIVRDFQVSKAHLLSKLGK